MAQKSPEQTVGDRFISALMGGILAFGTMLVVWFVIMYLGGRAGQDVSFPFYWVWIVAGLAAVVGFAAGPERLMDGFASLWGGFGELLFWPWRADDEEILRSRRRKSR
jgi:hypothetical protein